MHIITDILEARAFAKNMGQSLNDVAYWDKWYALEVLVTPPMDWIKQAKATALLRSQLPDGDGSLLWLDGSLLVIFKNEGSFDVKDISASVIETIGSQDVVANLISIVSETDKVHEILTRAQGEEGRELKPPPASYRFLKSLVPNIEDLLHGWHTERQSFKGREKPLILIVDDDAMTLRLVSRALARDYEVVTAESGAEAIAKHLQLMPDIIFLDIGLPDCDGLTLLNYMQQYDQECRIVMFSADDFLKTRVRAFAGGAKGFLGKPFSLRAFQTQITAWFSSKE